MGLMKRLDRASALVDGMAERLGLDLSRSMRRDPEQMAHDYRKMVLRCATCDGQSECAALQAGADRLDAPPKWCRNHSLLAH